MGSVTTKYLESMGLVSISTGPGTAAPSQDPLWTVFQTLIGDLNFVSKSLRNFQSTLKLYSSLMNMEKQ